MATAVATTARSSPAIGTYDRMFYSGMAIAMAITVFAGFAPTYYLRTLFGAPPTISGSTTLSPLTQVHAALFTGWVILFIVQTALVASHRTRTHQRMGLAGCLLAAAMLPVGTITAIATAARGSAPPGVDPLAFLLIPLFDMLLFGAFVAAAVWQRRQRETHKRLMLLAYISIITAAVARLPGVFAYGPIAFFALSLVFLVFGVVYDVVSRGRVHPVYVWGGVVLVSSVPLRLAISTTGAWRGIAELLTRL